MADRTAELNTAIQMLIGEDTKRDDKRNAYTSQIVGSMAIDLNRIANALEVIAIAHDTRIVGESALDYGQGGGQK